MDFEKKYRPDLAEPRRVDQWNDSGVYHFDRQQPGAVYSIDTPPPTVSGILHLGHVYSYSQTDFFARYRRMQGFNVYYPMGYDDNGLPTERLVERILGIRAVDVGRTAFIQRCLEFSEAAEREYQHLWQRLGLSVDWRFTYRTIDERSRRISQASFVDLHHEGLAYRKDAPAIWCPECQTAIAQADLDDLIRETEFITLAFSTPAGEVVPVATTRPELLPACVAVFVHPEDERYRDWIGKEVIVPLTQRRVPILEDSQVDREKGSGAVMCCTFGDTVDVEWWYTHQLPLYPIIGRDGRLTSGAGEFAGMTVKEARDRIKEELEKRSFILDRQAAEQSIRVHERCDTPVEYRITPQWFIQVLEHKQELLDLGDQVKWYPHSMKTRFREWVENLHWDWCISRQRVYGVPIPAWTCACCGEIRVADREQLPVDPLEVSPSIPCSCGSGEFIPETDVMDTWATSSMTPQIAGQWMQNPDFYAQVFPFSLRSQAHEIIRTWAFYTLVKSYHHFRSIPWHEIAVSGWGLAPQGTAKLSKSRGGGPIQPLEMIERYSADAVRYWAASTSLGKDAQISEEKIQSGSRLVTKLWNVARFSQRFLEAYQPPDHLPTGTPADRWILARLQQTIERVTHAFEVYEYAAAKNELELFFWRDLTDQYLEMAKQRLYEEANPNRTSAVYTLYHCLLAVIQMFAPILPFVTEEIYQQLFTGPRGEGSIHRSMWPSGEEIWRDPDSEGWGELLTELTAVVRKFKTDRSLSLAEPLDELILATPDESIRTVLRQSEADLQSVSRAKILSITDVLPVGQEALNPGSKVLVAVVGPIQSAGATRRDRAAQG